VPSPTINGSVTRVLVCEDENALRHALCDLIEGTDSLELVGAASDADEAIALARKHRPDVALVDVKMPQGGGERAVREICAERPETHIVALSAYEDRATVISMLRAGALGFLVKGVSPNEILEAIFRASRGQASLAGTIMARITEALAAEGATRREVATETERRAAALLEAAPEGIVITDGDGQIVLANEQTELLFGYARDDLLHRPIEMLLPARFRGRHVAHRRDYLAAPVTRQMGAGLELAGLRKDGSEFPLDVSLSELETAEGTLVIALVRDMTERLEEKLARALVERRALLGYLVTAGEEERERIAANIHDDSIQAITAAGMRLQILRRTITDPDQLALLGALEETIQLSISRLRHLLFELRPPALDREGLAAALRMYLEEWDAGAQYELEERLASQPAEETRLILYRIAQEALRNVSKHASADGVRVVLDERDGGYLVRITDDGVGFVPDGLSPIPGHLGLASMRERAELAGGWLRVDSAPDAGTIVEFWIPSRRDVETAVPA
jgi:PAS domain S-box-containing protein